MNLSLDILSKAATQARGLAMDAVAACKSGHLGLPLGDAEMGAVLFGHALRYNSQDPQWLNRDRFVLSAGHGSMFLYSWLHLAGYAISLEEIKSFRKLHSITPGHPEFHETPGVEATTGPLGQGVGNATGMAVAAKMAEARFNTAGHRIFDHHVVVLAGDGCLQEGVAMEASSFAGHQKLDNLILIYDSNDVTLDAMAVETQSEDTGKRYEAMGWDVQTVNGNDMVAFLEAFEKAKSATGKPQMIIARTLIGKGIPEVAGTQKAHGEGGAKFVDAARKAIGLPDEKFYVSDDVRAYFKTHAESLKGEYDAWQKTFSAWQSANPELAATLETGRKHGIPSDLLSKIPAFDPTKPLSTRVAGGDILNVLAPEVPLLISGSADLYGSTMNYIKSAPDFEPAHHDGRNIRFGIREHGMCAILNGIAYYGLFRPSGATFLVFADYCRPSIRLASLSKLPVIYIFTHDSVGVGEDGPTHQPVETVSGLRVIPGLDVVRPADPEETAGAWVAALEKTDGPTLFALTRQAVPTLDEICITDRRTGVAKGAYIARKETGDLKLIVMASGSELQHALAGAKQIGDGVRVISVPSFHRFDAQSAEYKESVLPASCTKRIAIEAGVPDLWYKYVGLNGKIIGIPRFGMSAKGEAVMEELGMNAASVVAAAKELGA